MLFPLWGCEAPYRAPLPQTAAAAGDPASQPIAPTYYSVDIDAWGPGNSRWYLRIGQGGSGTVGFHGLGGTTAEGTYSLPQVMQKLEPSIQAERTSERQYSVSVSTSDGTARYFTSDYETVAALFDLARPYMALEDVETLETEPPPGLAPSKVDWRQVADDLSRSSIRDLRLARSDFWPTDVEQIRRMLVEGRPISREEYQGRHSMNDHALKGESKTPESGKYEKYEWKLYRGGIGVVRTPKGEVVLLEIDLPTTRPTE